ncbi:MAG TPA: RHS repeat-associated core domain-containing protein [Acidobacteriaceae bacterium]|nr:RHS repeat-associated core domain-containing protein [Acidobacteriaceae bacterium]
MAVSGSTITWLHTNVYAVGRLIATYDQTGKGLHFYQDDPLGTRRSQSDPSGAQELTCSSLPFGDALSCSGPGADPTEQHFTGKERDAESGNDYFFARYYSSSTGRFLSPDWAAKVEPVPYAKLENPQSLNLYAYVENDPPTGLDPDGHQILGRSVGSCAANAAGNGCSTGQSDRYQQFASQNQAQQQNNVSATGQGQNQTNSSGHPIDKDAITNYADQHAEPHSLGKCAAYCRRAFEAGGVDTNGHPIDAKDWGPTLLKNGATVISPDGYTPQKADVAVFAGSDAHPHGHITIYDGKQWVSDFKQRNMSPYRSGTTPVTIYRFPDN